MGVFRSLCGPVPQEAFTARQKAGGGGNANLSSSDDEGVVVRLIFLV